MSKSVQSNSAVLVHFTLKLDDGSPAESPRNNGTPALILKDWNNIFWG